MFSSSSSSSLHDKSASRLVPFIIEAYDSNSSWDIAYYSQYCFVGTGPRGEILRSTDRYHWGIYYVVNDLNVSALHVYGNYLYAGTNPNGKIYCFNMLDDSYSYYGEFDGSIVGFVTYNGVVYAATERGKVYYYDSINRQWRFLYHSYGEIQRIDVFNGKIHLAMKASNVITYNGSEWSLMDMGDKNIESIRNVTGEFSFIDFQPLNITSIDGLEGTSKIYETYPLNRSIGLSCIEKDGSSILMGSYNKARVYSLLGNELKLLFDTNSTNVYDILNIDLGVNLAAIDNKLYLLYCGELPENAFSSSASNGVVVGNNNDLPAVSYTDPNANKSIVLTYPNGGEQFELGQDINIQWSSTKGLNDAVRIALYKDEEEVEEIVAQTSNDGDFLWTVPFAIPTGEDYKIYIEWLSTNTASDTDKDLSDGSFSLGFVTTTTTTTTTATPDPQAPDTSSCRGIPILVLPDDEHITKMTKDDSINAVILLTSEGRVLECKESVINGYLTGNRTIWANVRDGMGISNSASQQYTYALYNRIIEVNEEKEIVKWKYIEKPASVAVGKVNGVFTSPALYVQEDIGAWRTLSWTETKLENTEILVSIKIADSLEELTSKGWDNTFKSQNGEGTNIIRDLSAVNLKGQYAQIKIDMESQGEVSPATTDITLVYSTKQASYFFTTRFSLENGADINKGLIVAEITEPVNTEVQIGICSTESNDWNDYRIVPLERFFDIDKYENLKIGMKFTTYDETHVPSVANFAMLFSGQEIQKVN